MLRYPTETRLFLVLLNLCVNEKTLGSHRDIPASDDILKKLMDEMTTKFSELERKIETQIKTYSQDVPDKVNNTWAEVVQNKQTVTDKTKVDEMK